MGSDIKYGLYSLQRSMRWRWPTAANVYASLFKHVPIRHYCPVFELAVESRDPWDCYHGCCTSTMLQLREYLRLLVAICNACGTFLTDICTRTLLLRRIIQLIHLIICACASWYQIEYEAFFSTRWSLYMVRYRPCMTKSDRNQSAGLRVTFWTYSCLIVSCPKILLT